eukprot:235916_1
MHAQSNPPLIALPVVCMTIQQQSLIPPRKKGKAHAIHLSRNVRSTCIIQDHHIPIGRGRGSRGYAANQSNNQNSSSNSNSNSGGSYSGSRGGSYSGSSGSSSGSGGSGGWYNTPRPTKRPTRKMGSSQPWATPEPTKRPTSKQRTTTNSSSGCSDEYCCANGWDQNCARKAKAICKGGTCCGKCIIGRKKGTTGCESDKKCERKVCGYDPFCCSESSHGYWDE